MIERLARVTLLASAMAALAGCAIKPPDFNANAGDDAALRHPVELRQGWQELVVPVAPHLDARSRTELADFVADWRRSGGGPVYVRMQNLLRDEKKLQEHFARVRAALVEEGLRGSVKLVREEAGPTDRVPVLVLSFARMKAQIVTRCGRWPDNLASSADTGWDNRVHADFGCAYQNMIAVQTADPRDFVTPHPQSSVDAQMRVRALSRMRSDEASSRPEGARN